MRACVCSQIFNSRRLFYKTIDNNLISIDVYKLSKSIYIYICVCTPKRDFYYFIFINLLTIRIKLNKYILK